MARPNFNQIMTIFSFQFSDLYLGSQRSWLSGVEGRINPVPVPTNWVKSLDELRALCIRLAKDSGKENFSVRFSDLTFRVSTLRALEEVVFVLRRFPETVPAFNQLGIHSKYVELLMTPNLTGLIVVAGSYSQGKTTTASALVKARLELYGGVGVAIEDPPEMKLEGAIGNGVCYQTWADQGEFGHCFRQAARWNPSMIFLGEVRDSEAAAEALRASINGCLVICTTHADSIPSTLERIYSLGSLNGSQDDVASLLASGLCAILYQKLEIGQNGVLQPKTSFLWMYDQSQMAVRSFIRKRQFVQVGDEVVAQLNRLLTKG